MRQLLMADVYENGELEAEPVVVETDAVTFSLLLDDGTRISFDRNELTEALSLSPLQREAA